MSTKITGVSGTSPPYSWPRCLMDHLMLWMPTTTEGSGVFELECVASAPGFVNTQAIARGLRRMIEKHCIGPVIKQLEVTAGTEN